MREAGNQIKNLDSRTIDNKYINFNILKNNNEINIFFDKETLNLIGWQTEDIYQNLVITYIYKILYNQKIELKRIIGMPEDRLLINQYSVILNGTEIININNIQPDIQNKEIILRNEEFFVMGENYSNSVDSRNYGPIKKNQIIGKVLGR